MTLKIEDGTNAQVSDLLNGLGVDSNTGESLSFSQVGYSNTYTATVSQSQNRYLHI